MRNYETFKERKTDEGSQRRKFVTQMTDDEKMQCAIMAKSAFQNKGITPSKHLIKNRTSYNMSNICQTLMRPDLCKYIKEYNEKAVVNHTTGVLMYHQRLLIKIPIEVDFMCTKLKKKQKGFLTMVYEISSGEITTAYYNNSEDSERIPNLKYYTEDLLVRYYKLHGYSKINPKW